MSVSLSGLWPLTKVMYTQLTSTPRIPTKSFDGKTVIVTGSNVGLGLEACRWMVKLGVSRIIMAVRNIDKGNAAAEDIRVSTACRPEVLEVWQLDLSSYESVVKFAEKAKNELSRLDAVLGNAGIGTATFRTTEDNEETITTNVVSLALLGFLLRPKLRQTALQFHTQTHFTITGSGLYECSDFKERKAVSGSIFKDINNEATANMADRYNLSKLLEMYIVRQMAAVTPLKGNGVIVNIVAPGLCDSQLHRERTLPAALKAIARTAEVGSRTLVDGASAGPETHGQYLVDCHIEKMKGLCGGKTGTELQRRFWNELKEKLEAIQPGVTDLS